MNLRDYVGNWSGTNRLWVTPGGPARESEANATIRIAAHNAFAVITYSWVNGSQPQDGMLLIRLAPEPSPIDMVWLDSWHTGGGFMTFRGEEDRNETISALGSYPAPPGPDWGWRILIAESEEKEIQLRMYNISPEGRASLAVETNLTQAVG